MKPFNKTNDILQASDIPPRATMTSRGEYKKQLAVLVAAAKANNLSFEDILPEKMLDHLKQMAELKTAREHIEQLEEREKDLKATNETLTNNIKEKQHEIDNLPAEYQALKVDLQQAQRQISLYRTTSEDAQERVERYRRQLDVIVGKQQADTFAAGKIEDLQIQIEEQQILINKLVEDNRKTKAMYEQLHDSDAKALERKDKQLANKEKELADKNEMLAGHHQRWADHIPVRTADSSSVPFNDADDEATLLDEVNDDYLEVQEQNIQLLQKNVALEENNAALKEQNDTLIAQLYKIIALQEQSLSAQPTAPQAPTTQNFTSIVPEAKSLNRFYDTIRQILGVFAQIFQASSNHESIPLSDLEAQLDDAQLALEDYYVAKEWMRADIQKSGYEDADQIALRKELGSMARSGFDSLSSLNTLYTGFWTFVNQLSEDPKTLSSLNGALCDVGRVQVIELNSVV